MLWCDNIGAGSLGSNPVFHSRAKYIEMFISSEKKIVAGKVNFHYMLTKEHIMFVNVAAILTKEQIMVCVS